MSYLQPPVRFATPDWSTTPEHRGWGASCVVADMVWVKTKRSGTSLQVEKRLAELVQLVLDYQESDLPSRPGYLLVDSQSWGYDCRGVMGNSSTPSIHSWGMAIDENAEENPQQYVPAGVHFADYKIVHTMPLWVPALWARYGWTWGGAYASSPVDPMHLECMSTVVEAAEATRAARSELVKQPVPPSPPEVLTDDQAAELASFGHRARLAENAFALNAKGALPTPPYTMSARLRTVEHAVEAATEHVGLGTVDPEVRADVWPNR
jgi:hypothetical protein